MAPKARPHHRQPTQEEQDQEEPSSEDEQEKEEEESSEEEKQNSYDDDEGEEEEEDQKNVNNDPSSRENGWVSDPGSEGSPSDYKLQRLRKPSKKRKNQESDEDRDTVRIGKKSRTEEKKSGGFITRLWSDEDEICLLNGMITFKKVKRVDPNTDMGAFYSFIKGKLKIDFSREQLRRKISRFKTRFFNALKKGGNVVFSKPHEDSVFELSKKIWGGGAVPSGNENVKNDTVKREDGDEIVGNAKDGDFWLKYPFLSKSFDNMVRHFPSLVTSDGGMSFMKERLSLIGNVKAKEFDEKWKQLIVEETELTYKMLSLMTEQVRMALYR